MNEDKPKTSKAHQKATNKYIKSHYDRINITLPKGKKDIIKSHSNSMNESVNQFINRSIDETIERDNSHFDGAGN